MPFSYLAPPIRRTFPTDSLGRLSNRLNLRWYPVFPIPMPRDFYPITIWIGFTIGTALDGPVKNKINEK